MSNNLEKWKANARAAQQNYSNLLSDRVWEEYNMAEEKSENMEKKLLWKKIAFVTCGVQETYKKEDKDLIDELHEKCIKYSQKIDGHIYAAFLFVCAFQGKEEGIHLPLIRVMKDDGRKTEKSYFIDHAGRVYEDWSNFLDENVLNGWWMCVPHSGIYSFIDEVQVDYYDQTTRGATLQTLDKVSTLTTIASTIGVLTGTILTFTPLAPIGVPLAAVSGIAGTPGAVYSTGRSISRLVDRGRHDQSISLSNAEARGCWISTVASVLSFGNMASTTLLARSAASGGLVTAGVRTFCTSLNVTSISVNGLGILNSVVDLASKKSEDITTLEILQLTTSIFFFTNSLVNFKTANQIVKDAQKATIDSMRGQLNDEASQKSFDQMLRNNKKQSGKMHGSADFIRGVKQIDNTNDFFQALGVEGTSTMGVKARFNRDGQVNINRELVIHPKSWMQIDEAQRTQILQASTDLMNKKITVEKFNESMARIVKEHRIAFENQRKTALANLSSAFREGKIENVEIGGRKIFSNLKPHEIDRLDSVLKTAGKNYNDQLVQTGIQFACNAECSNVTEFCAAFEYVLRQIEADVKSTRNASPNEWKQSNMTAADYYQAKVCEEFGTPAKMADCLRKFTSLKRECQAANSQSDQRFGNSMAAANHYDKHCNFPSIDPNSPLTIERYFSMAREMTSQPITAGNSRLTQDGSSVCITYKDPLNGAVAIRYESINDGKSVIATLMYDRRVVNMRLFEFNEAA